MKRNPCSRARGLLLCIYNIAGGMSLVPAVAVAALAAATPAPEARPPSAAVWVKIGVFVLAAISPCAEPLQVVDTTAAVPPCATDADCAYAGSCNVTTGTCACRPQFTGRRCSALALAPMASDAGLHLEHNWTWGGSVIRGLDGKFHMFAMTLQSRCGIQTVYTNAEILHATADVPEGPFTVRGVALRNRPGMWDGDVVSEPAVYQHNGTYIMYYMGLNNTLSKPLDCVKHDVPAIKGYGARRIGVAWSDSLEGPWQRSDEPIFGPSSDSHDCDTHDVSNPVVAISHNGSTIMVYKGEGPGKASKCLGGMMGIATASHWRGPFIRGGHAVHDGKTRHNSLACEDPYIWFDRGGGVFRILTHACLAKARGGATGVGGHLWSQNGLDWTEAWVACNKTVMDCPGDSDWAYNGTVVLTNGSKIDFERRERPQVLLDEHGELQCVYNAAQPCAGTWGDTCHSYTIAQCVAKTSG